MKTFIRSCRKVGRRRVTRTILLAGVGLLIFVPPALAEPIPTDVTCATGESKYLFPVGTFLYKGAPGPLNTTLALTAGDRLTVTKSLSYDQYVGRSAVVQANEQWALRIGTATTSLTPDVPDLLDYADTSRVNTALGSVVAPLSGNVEIVHSSLVQPVDDSPNSVRPVGFCYRLEQPYDLTLTKTTITTAVLSGSSVTYQIAVANLGPGIASGWKVTDLIDAGATISAVAATVDGTATCTVASASCTSTGPLAPGSSVVITVTATISAIQGSVRNLAYVEPPATDLPELVPLGPVPTGTTDTAVTPTNNDGHADIVVTPPSTTPTWSTSSSTTPSTTPAPTAPLTVVLPSSAPTTAALPSTTALPATTLSSTQPASAPSTLPVSTGPEVKGTQVVRTVADTPTDIPTEPDLPFTGSDNSSLMLLGTALLSCGIAFVALARIQRRRPKR